MIDFTTTRRPTSEAELRSIQDLAYELASKSRYEDALSVCNWLIEEELTEVAGYRERSAVKDHMHDLEGAILDLQAVISRSDREQADFYTLGKLLFQSGSTGEAILAFDTAIALGEETGVHYYTNSSLLLRSAAHFKQTQYAAALADAQRLPPAYSTYVPGTGMQAKEQIAGAASEALRKQRENRFRVK